MDKKKRKQWQKEIRIKIMNLMDAYPDWMTRSSDDCVVQRIKELRIALECVGKLYSRSMDK